MIALAAVAALAFTSSAMAFDGVPAQERYSHIADPAYGKAVPASLAPNIIVEPRQADDGCCGEDEAMDAEHWTFGWSPEFWSGDIVLNISAPDEDGQSRQVIDQTERLLLLQNALKDKAQLRGGTIYMMTSRSVAQESGGLRYRPRPDMIGRLAPTEEWTATTFLKAAAPALAKN
jgi:hypothetical protein